MKLYEISDQVSDQYWMVSVSVNMEYANVASLDEVIVQQSRRFNTAFAKISWIIRTSDEGKLWTKYLFGISGNDIIKVRQSLVRGFRRLIRGNIPFEMVGVGTPVELKTGDPERVHGYEARHHDEVVLLKGDY